MAEHSISRRNLIQRAGACGAAAAVGAASAQAAAPADPPREARQKSVLALKYPPLDQVRVGLIGMGGRGMSLMGNLLDIDKAVVTAVCDVVPERVAAAVARVKAKGQATPAGYSKNDTDYRSLCARDDVDIVYVATPWADHVPMAAAAMKAGKHVAIEVPAAITLQQCWDLVDTAERTQRHCMMLENCCYGEMEMLVMNMVRKGVLGQLTHAEAGYLHAFADGLLSNADSMVWRRRHLMESNGNLYPTHGLGPVALYMDVHGGDRFETLVSMSSCERSLSAARDRLPADDPRRKETYACGDVNTTLIKTALGRTIMVQFDIVTPRPYSRINLLCGTDGVFGDYPPRISLRGKSHQWESDLAPYVEKHGHPLWVRHKAQALKSGGHGGMDYLMNWRLVHCLLAGKPLDMTVYDAAAWSSVYPLSIASVASGSAPVRVPDFTRGQWKAPRPLLAGEA
ncbi:MAG: Glycosyl hydrolase family 109 protein 1 precursor [Planctomycetes bacterium ADurb.Bin126]|nr:MAG: Glycosyl hydrolase family 109 protein 1 precursor [Planctomycetes bacterium ADurb.Bin126]HOD80270.1 Gfo/Idh/MocA family oxidoreductase [Phycisphaerae bacterium]HQL72181.1 Gfo/Idh/MocA family oxidoreductase [Phycisphaerae bacterium]